MSTQRRNCLGCACLIGRYFIQTPSVITKIFNDVLSNLNIIVY